MLKQRLNPKVEVQHATEGDIPRNVDEVAARFVAEHPNLTVKETWRLEATRTINSDILPALGHYTLHKLLRTGLTAVIYKAA